MRLLGVKDKASGGLAEQEFKDDDGSFLKAIFANKPAPAMEGIFIAFGQLQAAESPAPVPAP
jgi:hypothetical protein